MTGEAVLKHYLAILKKSKEVPTMADLEDVGIKRHDVRGSYGTLTALGKVAKRTAPEDWKNANVSQGAKAEILKAYCELIVQLNRPPTLSELAEKRGCHDRTVLTHFRSLEGVHEAAQAMFPNKFESLFTSEAFTPTQFDKYRSKIKKYKRFVITTAVAGCQVNPACWAAVEQYADANKALPLLLPIADPARPNTRNGLMFFDRALQDEVFVFDDLSLNKHCHISNILISAKQINPATGLKRLGSRKGAFIYASPKQSLSSVANSSDIPLMVITPGAITDGDYTTDRYMSNRSANIAMNDHVMGAIIVEIVDDSKFHWRPIEFNSKGAMTDLGVTYNGRTIAGAKTAAIAYPDLHVAESDPSANKAFVSIIKSLKPDWIAVHDAFDGLAVNPHNRRKLNTRAKQKGVLSLDKEAQEFVAVINGLTSLAAKGVRIIASNHNERLERWVEDGAYIYDAENYVIGHELALAMHRGMDLTQALSTKYGLSKDVHFMKRDESFAVGENPVELGYHGDQGPHGSRGSLEKMDESLGRCITGHSHVPGIFRRAWSVGTASTLRQGWNKGPSAWSHTIGVVYADGTRQLITIIDGKWCL